MIIWLRFHITILARDHHVFLFFKSTQALSFFAGGKEEDWVGGWCFCGRKSVESQTSWLICVLMCWYDVFLQQFKERSLGDSCQLGVEHKGGWIWGLCWSSTAPGSAPAAASFSKKNGCLSFLVTYTFNKAGSTHFWSNGQKPSVLFVVNGVRFPCLYYWVQVFCSCLLTRSTRGWNTCSALQCQHQRKISTGYKFLIIPKRHTETNRQKRKKTKEIRTRWAPS